MALRAAMTHSLLIFCCAGTGKDPALAWLCSLFSASAGVALLDFVFVSATSAFLASSLQAWMAVFKASLLSLSFKQVHKTSERANSWHFRLKRSSLVPAKHETNFYSIISKNSSRTFNFLKRVTFKIRRKLTQKCIFSLSITISVGCDHQVFFRISKVNVLKILFLCLVVSPSNNMRNLIILEQLIFFSTFTTPSKEQMVSGLKLFQIEVQTSNMEGLEILKSI